MSHAIPQDPTGTIADFLNEVHAVCRLRHLSIHTEDSYLQTICRFIVFHGKKHPAKLGADAVREYLTHLAVERRVAASTQNVALNALVFLYRDVLKTEMAETIAGYERAQRPACLPTVFTRAEAQALLSHLGEPHRLMAGLLYGSGLRLTECLRLPARHRNHRPARNPVRVSGGYSFSRLSFSAAKNKTARIVTSGREDAIYFPVSEA